MSFQEWVGCAGNGVRVATVAMAGVALMAGCGGGGDGGAVSVNAPSTVGTGVVAASPAAGASAPPTTAEHASAALPPDTATVAVYKTLRTRLTAAMPAASAPGAAGAAELLFAVGELRAALGATGNAAVVPPLTQAALNSLAAAATGATLAEIASRFDTAPAPWVAAEKTGRVARQLWADRGRPLRIDFLAATDAFGAPPRLDAWTAAEVGFSDGSAASDPSLSAAMSAAGVSLGSFSSPTDIRLLSVDRLAVNVAWTTAVSFDGVFERATHDLLRLPMLRLTAGVRRHAGADFTADVVGAGDLRVMSLRPAAGTLRDFAASRLEPALAEAIEALLGDTALSAPPAAADMVLPVLDFTVAAAADAPLLRAGVHQVYDPVNADLHGLDGVGGTYVQARSADARLTLAAGGLSLSTAHAMAYTFSPLNLHYTPTYGAVTTQIFIPPGGFISFADADTVCTWPTPDLRSFFLAVLDRRNWVISLLAVQAPGGTAVAPTCS